ncbi:helix-turn-helix domain-containing protein [Methylocystis sp.]|uniref:helix-turn-helix domain-containing protein n=1 Tax=Methylocystis sp. TaxID=1911079 RepID=UPI003DA5ACA9
MVAAQAATRDFAAKPDASEAVVHKWLFRVQTEAKEAIGVTDRALSVLHELLSFHQETALTLPERDPKSESEDNSAGAGVVVYGTGSSRSAPWQGAGDAAPVGVARRGGADHPARLTQRQTLRQARAGRRD